MNESICVIIPFFQRKSGVLARALKSINESEGVSAVSVIVVDDSSPVSAEEELKSLGNVRFPVSVIHQENGGPGSARNTGLENVPPATRVVAFLDSDDTWLPGHLATAVQAIQAGADVFFSDHFQLNSSVSAFSRSGKIKIEDHEPLVPEANVFRYIGDMLSRIICGNVIGTSTVVYDYSRFQDMRFRTDLTSAGEDYLFWMEFATRDAVFAFGYTPDVIYMDGVNVYSGSGWGTDRHAKRIVDELMYRRATFRNFDLNDGSRAFVMRAVADLRVAYWRDFIHRVFNRKPIHWRLTGSVLLSDPAIVFGLPVMILRKFAKG